VLLGFLTQGLAIARKVLYHLSHVHSPRLILLRLETHMHTILENNHINLHLNKKGYKAICFIASSATFNISHLALKNAVNLSD
jgi:hypothetical protein